MKAYLRMRGNWWMNLIIGLLLIGCEGHQAERASLDRAEALVETQADSARALLDSIPTPENLSEKLFARWCMLRSKVSDKLSEDMPYVEQLQRAQEWYKSHGTAEERAWIGLYLGRSYVEDKLFIPATNAYSEALDIALKGKAYNVAGYICSYMGDLYEYTHQTSEARRKYEEAAKYFDKAGNKRSYAHALRDVGITYCYGSKKDIALKYVLKADSIINKIGSNQDKIVLSNNMGRVYRVLGKLKEAKQCYLNSISADSLSNAVNYLAISILYYENNMLDSSKVYFRKIIKTTKNPYTNMDRLYLGYLIEKESNDIPSALSYLEDYLSEKDSIYDASKQVDIIDAEKRHDVTNLLAYNSELESSNYLYASIAFIAVIFALIGYLIYQAREKRHIKWINIQNERLRSAQIRMNELEIEVSQKHSNREEINSLQTELQSTRKTLLDLQGNRFNNAAIVRKLRKQSQIIDPEKRLPLSRKDWNSLTSLIVVTYPNCSTFFLDNPYNMTDTEMEICLLSFLQLDVKEESRLLNINPDSISKRRLRTRQRLGLTKSEQTIYAFLLAL